MRSIEKYVLSFIAGLIAFGCIAGAMTLKPAGAQTDTSPLRMQEAYGTAPITTYRAASNTADTADVFSMSSLTRIGNPLGKPHLRVHARFTTASATATLTMVRGIPQPFSLWMPGDHTSIVATAPANVSGAVKANGLYCADGALFDMSGTPFVVVAVTALSAGSVTLITEGPY